MDEYAKHNEKYKVLYIMRADTIVCFVWTAKSGHWREHNKKSRLFGGSESP